MARARIWVSARPVRVVKARAAPEADGSVRRVGNAMVLSVYESPWSRHAGQLTAGGDGYFSNALGKGWVDVRLRDRGK